jgi:hypothetical protein
VSADAINLVFAGSGLFGDEDDVVARRFRLAGADWCIDNYLHEAEGDDWREILAELVARRRADALGARSPWRRPGGALRDAWERKQVLGPLDRSVGGALAYAAGVPARAVVRAGQRAARSGTS